MEEEVQEFETCRSNTRSFPKPHPHRTTIYECRKIEQLLVESQLKRAIGELEEVCYPEFHFGVDQGFIFSIQIRENQHSQLPKFLSMLEQKLLTSAPQKMQVSRAQLLIKSLGGTEVRDIVLQMYVFIEEHPEAQVIIFLCEQVTNLNQHNIYTFEKGLKGKKFMAVMATHSTFDNQVEYNHEVNFIKFHISLYNPKELFCKFMYQCISREDIKAYLPHQILSLITDMDYYSISFRQNCRRFVYCLQRSLTLVKKQRIWVDFYNLIDLIEDTIKRKFYNYQGYKKSLQKILKVILSEKDLYTIPEKSLSLELAMSESQSPVDEDTWMMNLRETLIKHLNKKQHFQIYVGFLQDQDNQMKPQKKYRKSRSELLGIDPKKGITSKHILESQITKIIKHSTQAIRAQAMLIKWADIKYQLRIKPPIPFLIHESVSKEEETSELIDTITSTYSASLAYYLDMFGKEDIGQTLYLLKRLELQGLVDISKKSIKPIVYNAFYPKGCFAGKH